LIDLGGCAGTPQAPFGEAGPANLVVLDAQWGTLADRTDAQGQNAIAEDAHGGRGIVSGGQEQAAQIEGRGVADRREAIGLRRVVAQ
jgi:hypothetical protein